MLLSTLDGRAFFYCPGCGTAWRTIADARRLATVEGIDKVSPGGFRIATKEELEQQGLWPVVVEALSEDDFKLP